MKELGLIPAPVELERREGLLDLEGGLQVPLGGLESPLRDLAARLAGGWSRATGTPVALREAGEGGGAVVRLERSEALRGEAYELEVGPAGAALRAGGEAGLLQAGRCLGQLLTAGRRTLPALVVRDHPRFSWRGLHLDVSRHFFPAEDVKRLLDLMALHGLNRFHWHLTDDQGWRLEIRSRPRLTELGSRRTESPRRGARAEGDGRPYGGFYSQEQVREVVAHAAALGIAVVPEIEMPGHATAALAAHPELGNTGRALEVATRWGIFEDTYSVSEETFSFLEDVLDEVLELFPFEFVHVGGDEAPKRQWRENPAAQERMRAEGLHDEDELQSWFIGRIGRFLAGRGRRLIGWDEIREGGCPEGAAVMVWRDVEHLVASVREGHEVVSCPTSHAYFDYYQADPEQEPEAIGGLLDLETVHGFEPVPAELDAAESGRVLGVQGNAWTEYIHDFDELCYMVFPRAAALSEVAWSPRERPAYEDFLARWRVHARRLDAAGVRYRSVD